MPGQNPEAIGLLQIHVLVCPTVSATHATNASAAMPLWQNKEDPDLFYGWRESLAVFHWLYLSTNVMKL